MFNFGLSRSWRPTRIGGLVLLAAATFLATPSARQDAETPGPAQGPVFRGGVNFVSVDAYPRRDGKVIEGLTAGSVKG